MPTMSVKDQQATLDAAMARIEAIRAQVERARIEKGVAEAQVAELKPRREALRAESQERYGVPITELSALSDAKTQALEERVSELERQYETLSAPAEGAQLLPVEAI